MPTTAVLVGDMARSAYVKNQYSLINTYVVVNGMMITANARVTNCTVVELPESRDTIFDLLFEFSSNGGTLQRLHATYVFPAAGQNWSIELCSDENISIPAGTIRIGKRFIIKAYYR
jgi:hypothetical protein